MKYHKGHRKKAGVRWKHIRETQKTKNDKSARCSFCTRNGLKGQLNLCSDTSCCWRRQGLVSRDPKAALELQRTFSKSSDAYPGTPYQILGSPLLKGKAQDSEEQAIRSMGSCPILGHRCLKETANLLLGRREAQRSWPSKIPESGKEEARKARCKRREKGAERHKRQERAE